MANIQQRLERSIMVYSILRRKQYGINKKIAPTAISPCRSLERIPETYTWQLLNVVFCACDNSFEIEIQNGRQREACNDKPSSLMCLWPLNFYKEKVWEKSVECTMQSNLFLLYWQNQGTFKSIERSYDAWMGRVHNAIKANLTIKRFQRLQRQQSSRPSSGFVDNWETTY